MQLAFPLWNRSHIVPGIVLIGAAVVAFVANYFNPVFAAMAWIVAGCAAGYCLATFIASNLSRDVHVSLLTAVAGMSLDSFLTQFTTDPGEAVGNFLKSLTKLAGVFGPLLFNAIRAFKLGDPSLDLVNTSVVALIFIFIVTLGVKLKDNPPAVSQMISSIGKLSPEERESVRKAFG